MEQAVVVTDVRLKKQLPAELTPVEPETVEEYWEGELDGQTGSTAGIWLDFRATLRFWRDAISGSGSGKDFPLGQEALSITGHTQGGSVELLIWLDAEGLTSKPLVCIGLLDAAAGTIAGAFSVDCMSPRTCTCGGGGGQFALRRVRGRAGAEW
jgi:hypothetical protein